MVKEAQFHNKCLANFLRCFKDKENFTDIYAFY